MLTYISCIILCYFDFKNATVVSSCNWPTSSVSMLTYYTITAPCRTQLGYHLLLQNATMSTLIVHFISQDAFLLELWWVSKVTTRALIKGKCCFQLSLIIHIGAEIIAESVPRRVKFKGSPCKCYLMAGFINKVNLGLKH